MENQTTVKSIAFSFGLGLALYTIAVTIIMYIMNIVEQNWIISLLNGLVSVFIIVTAINKYKKDNKGFISLSQALKVGMATVAIASVISAIYMFIHFSYIAPEAIDLMKEAQRQQMTEMSGQLTDEQIDQSMKVMEFTTSPFFIATMTMIVSVFLGFIISLIVGLIVQKKRAV